ncbi:extracellular solute-binding protein [Paenibacillus pasadenensis]|uniref:extracellular solute-binding protein n=1 Tax=Paenibacillus pasadenensis TaxID=217090 RepID=UPI0020407AD3|nr:extracellular solute-binding protein [Paenibacillus pasadenensis]MCM3747008.1 extracellular solute-binding protein [Paenibacillus pasadenensis]
MKKTWKGAFALTAAAAMLFVTACSGGNGGNAGGNNTSANSEKEQSGSETLKIKVMANHDQATLSASDKKWIEQMEKDMGVDIEYEIPPVTGYQERVQLMLASGDYPDLVYFPGTNDQSFVNAVKDGLIVPVNKYIESAENIKKYTYETSWNALKVQQDENIYGIPRTTVIRNDAFWFRKDWLAKIGFDIPADSEITVDQFTEILTKFTKDDPDGNGKADTYGLAAGVDGNKVLQPVLTSQFGLLGWQKTEGGDYQYLDATYDRKSDAYKKALDYTARLSGEGLLDPDAAVNNAVSARERFWRGITGVMGGFAGHYSWHSTELKKLNANADLTYLFVKNETDGKVAGQGFGVGLWGFWGITSTAKDPQKIVDMLEYYLDDANYETMMNGYEDIDYKNENGKLTVADNKEEAPVRRNTMRRAGDIQIYFTAATPQEEIDMSKPWLEKSVNTVVLSKNLDFMPEASKKPNFMDYKKTWDQTIMSIVLGQTPVDKFDELLDGWYKNGGEEYVQEMNAFIEKSEGASK